MSCSGPQSARNRILLAIALIALALAAGCARPDRSNYEDVRKTKTAALLPPDIAMAFLQEIRSRPGKSLLAGETTIPPCQFTEKGVWSGGQYRKLAGRRAPNYVTEYKGWILYKIEDPSGHDFTAAELDKPNAWNYSLRTPRSARTVFGTTDHCLIGPTTEPARKIVEALAALGVEVAPEYAYIVPRN
jgi:hypothetical protein